MPRHPLPRVACATLALVGAMIACTGSPVAPDASPPPASPNATATSPATTPTPSDGTFALTAGRVSIRPPHGGSLRVHGRYPWSPSRCVHPDRPTLDGRYPGTLAIRTASDGTLTVAVTLTFEAYLEGIAEVPPTWPTAALEAQAIAARSYVLSTTGWSGAQGSSLDTPICGTSACQVYGGIPVPRPPGLRRWYAAVHDTRGQVLLSGGRPADTVYFSTSNGRTYGNEDVFGSAPLPYLRPVIERDDGASPLSRWHVAVPFRDLTTVLRTAGQWPRNATIASASVSGGVVRITGDGHSRTLSASQLRDAMNTWGPCKLPGRYPSGGLPVTIPSGWFGMTSGAHALTFDGRGWGHGVGMVQWGAYGKAARGWSASRILAFYYGGLTPQAFPEPGTMTVIVATGLRSMTVGPFGSDVTIAGQAVPKGILRIVGGDAVTVTSSGATSLSAAANEVPPDGPGFTGGVYRIGPSLRRRLVGRNWHPGCPVPIDELRRVQVAYRDFRGRVRSGPLIVNARVARDVLWVFHRLFDARFPIHRMALPARYRPPRPRDWFSTQDVTAAFNCRPVTDQPGSISQHAYGWAIDINPLLNPYVRSDGSVLRRAVKPYLDRSRQVAGMIHAGDVVVRAFARIGWSWGGDWTTIKDYMHFSLTGR